MTRQTSSLRSDSLGPHQPQPGRACAGMQTPGCGGWPGSSVLPGPPPLQAIRAGWTERSQAAWATRQPPDECTTTARNPGGLPQLREEGPGEQRRGVRVRVGGHFPQRPKARGRACLRALWSLNGGPWTWSSCKLHCSLLHPFSQAPTAAGLAAQARATSPLASSLAVAATDTEPGANGTLGPLAEAQPGATPAPWTSQRADLPCRTSLESCLCGNPRSPHPMGAEELTFGLMLRKPRAEGALSGWHSAQLSRPQPHNYRGHTCLLALDAADSQFPAWPHPQWPCDLAGPRRPHLGPAPSTAPHTSAPRSLERTPSLT